MPLPVLTLQIRVHGRHPWFYRKMVRKPERPLPAGSVVHVRDRDRRPVGTAFYNPRSELALRLISSELLDDVQDWFVAALAGAAKLREQVLALPQVTDAYRMLHAEGDGFPGLILDRLGDAFVAQVHSLGMQKQLEPLGEWLLEHQPGSKLVLLQDSQAIEREGMERIPPARPHPVTVREHGVRYQVQAGGGHKTGFFADQRDNRLLVRSLSAGRRVLDLCCNAGGFAMNAVLGKARSVLAADLDETTVAVAQQNLKDNRLKADCVHADAFDLLREQAPGSSDLIVLDPPKWVPRKEEIEAGLERYRDLNRLGLQALDRGGLLVTCSCSGSVSEDSFLKMLREAAAQARRDARVLCLRGAGPDHPVALECPETRYLKVAVLQVR